MAAVHTLLLNVSMRSSIVAAYQRRTVLYGCDTLTAGTLHISFELYFSLSVPLRDMTKTHSYLRVRLALFLTGPDDRQCQGSRARNDAVQIEVFKRCMDVPADRSDTADGWCTHARGET